MLVQITRDRVEGSGGTPLQDVIDPTSVLAAFNEVVKRNKSLIVVALAEETAVDSGGGDCGCCRRGHRSSHGA